MCGRLWQGAYSTLHVPLGSGRCERGRYALSLMLGLARGWIGRAIPLHHGRATARRVCSMLHSWEPVPIHVSIVSDGRFRKADVDQSVG